MDENGPGVIRGRVFYGLAAGPAFQDGLQRLQVHMPHWAAGLGNGFERDGDDWVFRDPGCNPARGQFTLPNPYGVPRALDADGMVELRRVGMSGSASALDHVVWSARVANTGNPVMTRSA